MECVHISVQPSPPSLPGCSSYETGTRSPSHSDPYSPPSPPRQPPFSCTPRSLAALTASCERNHTGCGFAPGAFHSVTQKLTRPVAGVGIRFPVKVESCVHLPHLPSIRPSMVAWNSAAVKGRRARPPPPGGSLSAPARTDTAVCHL